ncbi:MAG: glycosyltransferase family 2 protein [Eubacteriales bacterium]
MGSVPKISVVIPVYNVENYLPQCLDSLCAQTLREIEIICVDDGSRDGSVDILRKYAEKDQRIRIYHNKKEGPGAAHARNLGIEKTRGEYVLILDSDDHFSTELAEKTYQKGKSTNADVVIFDAIKFDTDTGVDIPTNQFVSYGLCPEKEFFSGRDVAQSLFVLTDSIAWNKLYRRTYIQEHGLSFQVVDVIDDAFFTYTALALAEKITVLPEILLYYRVNNSASQLSNRDRDPLSPVKVGVALKEWLNERDLFELYEASYYKRVLMMVHVYFDTLKLEENYTILYNHLHSEGISALDLERGCEKGMITGTMKNWVQHVVTQDLATFEGEREKENRRKISQGTPCTIYGCGIRADYVAQQIESCGGKLVGAVDSSEERQGQFYREIEILSPSQLIPEEVGLLVVTTMVFFDVIRAHLLELGFEDEKIILI